MLIPLPNPEAVRSEEFRRDNLLSTLCQLLCNPEKNAVGVDARLKWDPDAYCLINGELYCYRILQITEPNLGLTRDELALMLSVNGVDIADLDTNMYSMKTTFSVMPVPGSLKLVTVVITLHIIIWKVGIDGPQHHTIELGKSSIFRTKMLRHRNLPTHDLTLPEGVRPEDLFPKPKEE